MVADLAGMAALEMIQSTQYSLRTLQEISQSPSSIIDRLLCQVEGGSGGSKKQYPVGIYLFVIGGIFSAITLATTNNLDGQYDLPLKFFGAPIASYMGIGGTWLGRIQGGIIGRCYTSITMNDIKKCYLMVITISMQWMQSFQDVK